MSKRIEIEALSTAEIAAEFGMEQRELRAAFAGAPYLNIIEDESDEWVPTIAWRRFVREAIRRSSTELEPQRDEFAEPGTSEVPRADAVVNGSDVHRFKPNWNFRRQGLVDRNPWLGRLAESFVNYVLDNDDTARAEPHGQTVTFWMTQGRRAGLRLRSGRGRERGGLWLAAQRGGSLESKWVHSEGDFTDALKWLQDLPGY